MDFFKNLKVDYKSGDLDNWTGRKSNLEDQYWHQKIKTSSIELIHKNTDVGIIGYACDEGVRRNQGRIGARKGPKSIRNKLGKLPIHFNKNVTDFGDVICVNNSMEDCQKALSKSITQLINNNIFPIAIGGGHDIAYASFNGINEALKNSLNNKIGIINFDAHFDLRSIENKPNSGTPFNQILEENKNASYFAIGIQQQSNTKELFEIAKKNNVSFATNFDCESFILDLKNNLEQFINKVDHLYITIDLDGFSSAYAPGVSAPSPFGFTPNFVYQVLEFLLSSKKVITCDIAELNPDLDIDNHTANLAARLIDFIITNS